MCLKYFDIICSLRGCLVHNSLLFLTFFDFFLKNVYNRLWAEMTHNPQVSISTLVRACLVLLYPKLSTPSRVFLWSFLIMRQVCKTCECEFNHHSYRQNCFECKPKRLTKAQRADLIKSGQNRCSSCYRTLPLLHFGKNINDDTGFRRVCKSCHHGYPITEKEYICEKCGDTFKSSSHTRKTCHCCTLQRDSLTKDMCLVISEGYPSRTDFQLNCQKIYHYCQYRGWYSEIAEHNNWPYLWGCWSYTSFQEACNRNNSNGFGTLYLIQCSLNDEFFYKIGITSRDLKSRFKGFAYNWEVLHVFYGEPLRICDMESELKKIIKPNVYTPLLWDARHSTECFTYEALHKVQEYWPLA